MDIRSTISHALLCALALGWTPGATAGTNAASTRAVDSSRPGPDRDRDLGRDRPTLPETSRFLAQATLGADLHTIETVRNTGFAAWLEQQFHQPPGRIEPAVRRRIERGLETLAQHRREAWWEQVLTSPDLVRQRVAVALGQILVISDVDESLARQPLGTAHYHDTLLTHAFGNYRDLLQAVALHPCMGLYLGHLRNEASDPTRNRHADENFARELMQLFSLGLDRLHPDGTPVLDANGDPIPAYGNDEVRELARVFTGLGLADDPTIRGGGTDYTRPMRVFAEHHDDGPKVLFGHAFPAGRAGSEEIDAALDVLFRHPNVGPFLGRLLIQRLVTSNPSPAYVRRVAAAFDDRGDGVRGDLRAVLRAILLDREARSLDALVDPHAGRLREPYLRKVHLARAYGAANRRGTFPIHDWESPDALGQRWMSAPTVFNFFRPDHVPPGELGAAGLAAPELQILSDTTATAGLNDVYLDVERGLNWADDARTVRLDLSALARAADRPAELIDRVDLVLTYGTLSPATRDVLLHALEATEDPVRRARLAVYLVAISPDYAVLR